MTADRITELESPVDGLEEVVTQSEDVEAVGLGRGSEQAISILATYVSEVADGFDLAEFLRRLLVVITRGIPRLMQSA